MIFVFTLKKYKILKESDADKLEKLINISAEQGWKPIHCWSHVKYEQKGAGFLTNVDHQYTHNYFCLIEKEK